MKKILAIIVLGLAFAATSCSDFFELKRPNQFPWQSASEFEMAVRAPYLYYVGAAWANPIGALTNRFGESDLARYTNKTGDSYFFAYWNRTYKTEVLDNYKELEGGFEYLYYMSSACNSALELIENAEANGTDPFPNMTAADKETVKRYKGELLFMRAFTYWNLARTWCPPYNDQTKDSKHIVVYRHNEKNSDVLKNGTLSTVQEVYDYILEDLKDAIAILPEDYNPGDPGKRMRANKYAAEALLARVLFYMGNFSEAKTYIDDVISKTDLYELDTDLVAPFNRTTSTATSKEVVWEITYSDASDRYDRNPGIMQYAAYNGHANKMCGYCAFSLSYYAMEKVGWLDESHNPTAEATGDLRFQNLYKFHPGGEGDSYPEPAIFLFKYFRGATPTDNGRRASRPMIRLSDLYLMRAQINLATNPTAATADVNVVRNRAGLANVAAATEEIIENERIKELAGENADRIYWLCALHKDIPLGDRPTDGTNGEVIRYPYSDYYYQIPLLERQSNKAYDEN